MSNGRFNPNDPYIIGLEWNAVDFLAEPINPANELAQRFTMPATATLRNIQFHSPSPPPGGTDANFCNWILGTVYEDGDERNFGVERETPLTVNAGTTTGAFVGGAASVQDALISLNDTKAIRLDPGEIVDMQFTGPFFHTPNPRILDVTFTAVAEVITTGGAVPPSIQFGYRLGSGTGNVIDLGKSALANEILTRQTRRLRTGEVFLGAYDYVATPADARRRVWLRGDLDNLASGVLQFHLVNTSPAQIVDLHFLNALVTYVTETRVAVGGLIRAQGSSAIDVPWEPGWQGSMDMIDARTGVLDAPLLGGRTYIATLTQAVNRVLDSAVEAAPTETLIHRQSGPSRDLSALRPTKGSPIEGLAYPRLLNGLIAGPGAKVDRGYSMVLIDAGGAPITGGSQPYSVIPTIQGDVVQDVISTTGGLYGFVRLTVRKVGGPADLTVEVGASTATLTGVEFDEIEQDALGYATVTLPLEPPVTVAPETNVGIVARTGSLVDHWEVPIFSTDNAEAVIDDATYGGREQAAVFPGLDIALRLLTAVPAVTGAEVGQGLQVLAPIATGCPVPASQFASIDYASVCWDAIPIVSGSPAITGTDGFCAWEVERRDDFDGDWRRIARVTDYNVRCASDFEGRIGVASDYRVRLCRLDGICGDWAVVTGFVRTGPSTETPPVAGAGCDGLVFTSNEKPDATLAYPYAFVTEGAPRERFEFPEGLPEESVMFQRLHMRDYQVAFRPLERGGVRFTRTLLVNALSAPPRILDEGFRDLRDLAWDSLSYVAVLDTRGNRWLAAVLVPDGTVRTSGQIYLASVDIVETTNRPSVVDVGAV